MMGWRLTLPLQIDGAILIIWGIVEFNASVPAPGVTSVPGYVAAMKVAPDARHSPYVEPQLGRGNGADWKLRTVTDWIKLAALSLLISTAITAVIGTAGFALWWWLMR